MGYESRIYVVRKSDHCYAREDSKVWGDVVAMVDMGKCYRLSEKLTKSPEASCYIYADNGNDEIKEDCYGMPLTETSVPDAIKYVKDAMEHIPYWRYNALLAILEAAAASDVSNLAVLHYGY